ncbi:MAG: hypothetical protein AAFY65_15890 [Pseudomonadota bacterium]
MIWLSWWVWALAAVALGILEVLVPGYIALGFGIGAGLVALGLLGGLLTPILDTAGGLGFGLLLILFGLCSGVAWWGLRAVFGPVGGTVQTFDDDVND